MLSSRQKYIAKIAQNIWEKHSLKIGFDIFKLIKNRGFVCEEEDLEDGMSGALIIDGNLKIIVLNKSDSERRKRFTMAHEMGHDLLHRDFSVSISPKGQGYTFFRDRKSFTGEHGKEIEANHFASCLLMPEDKILQKINSDTFQDSSIEVLANQFKVSKIAMAIRISKLGYT